MKNQLPSKTGRQRAHVDLAAHLCLRVNDCVVFTYGCISLWSFEPPVRKANHFSRTLWIINPSYNSHGNRLWQLSEHLYSWTLKVYACVSGSLTRHNSQGLGWQLIFNRGGILNGRRGEGPEMLSLSPGWLPLKPRTLSELTTGIYSPQKGLGCFKTSRVIG